MEAGPPPFRAGAADAGRLHPSLHAEWRGFLGDALDAAGRPLPATAVVGGPVAPAEPSVGDGIDPCLLAGLDGTVIVRLAPINGLRCEAEGLIGRCSRR